MKSNCFGIKKVKDSYVQALIKKLFVCGRMNHFVILTQKLKIMRKKVFEMSFFLKPITNKKHKREVSLLEVYKVIRSTFYKKVTIQLRAIDDKEKQKKFKNNNFDFVTPSGTFAYHRDKSLVVHSGMLCIDLDCLDDVERMKQKLLIDPLIGTLLLFRSPRGHGLKWFISIDIEKHNHAIWFEGVRNYLIKTYALTEKQVDASCRNVSKACFLCYDPDAYLNPLMMNPNNQEIPANKLNPQEWIISEKEKAAPVRVEVPKMRMKARPSSQGMHDELTKAKIVCDELIKRGINIAESYEDYLKLGFALANGLGEDGHDIYHKLCSQSSKYREKDCEEKWQECLSKNDGRITIATFYNMAKKAEIDLSIIGW